MSNIFYTALICFGLVVVRPPNVVKLGKCSLVWRITIVAVENIALFICGTDPMMVIHWNQVS